MGEADDEEDGQEVDEGKKRKSGTPGAAPDTQAEVTCGSCLLPGHTLAKCRKLVDGVVVGCVVCNDKNHYTDACPQVPGSEEIDNSKWRNQMYDHYVVARGGRPSLSTTNYNWVAEAATKTGMPMRGYPMPPYQGYNWFRAQQEAHGEGFWQRFDYVTDKRETSDYVSLEDLRTKLQDDAVLHNVFWVPELESDQVIDRGRPAGGCG
jgi:hypothetical protein